VRSAGGAGATREATPGLADGVAAARNVLCVALDRGGAQASIPRCAADALSLGGKVIVLAAYSPPLSLWEAAGSTVAPWAIRPPAERFRSEVKEMAGPLASTVSQVSLVDADRLVPVVGALLGEGLVALLRVGCRSRRSADRRFAEHIARLLPGSSVESA